ncbi:MAG: NAD(P)/FAD-dependent oxidoreductase, partial [Bacilli bacterium]|nr:NAD(P)/FAD-dependent oxidoreductase [Bacilli bacterium]
LDDFIAREEGEVLFKKDGLSGIVIFNCSSYISHLGNADGVKIILDLFPQVNQTTLTTDLFDAMKLHPSYFLDAYLTPALRDYVLKEANLPTPKSADKVYCYKLAKAMKGLCFHYAGSYGFEDSQVTIGGISLRNIDASLTSSLEKHVSFAGETLDVDGLCGGHNLTWCLVSALVVSKSF